MNPQRWSCKVMLIRPRGLLRPVTAERIQDELNRAGAQGWELVSVTMLGIAVARCFF